MKTEIYLIVMIAVLDVHEDIGIIHNCFKSSVIKYFF